MPAPASPAATNQPAAALIPEVSDPFPDLRFGPFDIQPRVTAGFTYDDNILLSSHNPESDLIWSLRPAFLAVAGDRLAIEDYRRTYHDVVSFSPDTFIITPPEEWPGRTLMVDYGPGFNWFTEHGRNDSLDEFLTVNALWPLHKMILGFRQDYMLQNTTVIEAGRRTQEQIIPTVLSAGYQFSDKTTAEINLTRTSVAYEASQHLADFTDWNMENWLNYQYGTRLNLGVGAALGKLDLPSQPGQVYETPEIRARYRYGTRLLLDGSLGEQMRQYDGGVPGSTTPVLNLTAHYIASENTTLHLTGFRREAPSGAFGYDYISTGLTLVLEHQFGDRYFAGLETTYYYSDYLETSPTLLSTQPIHEVDNFIEIRPSFKVRFSQHLAGTVYYLFRTVQSRQWDGWADQQLGVRLTWTY
jgi:hypothetical protein